MIITFYKYQGTGNDFVMVDNRDLAFPKNDTSLINRLCDRRFGIGADGLILLENDKNADFSMSYYNSDGNVGSMCGNGGRCIVAFAKQLGIIERDTTFSATDGLHHATISDDGIVSLQMIDVQKLDINPDYVFLNTGSPHHVQMCTNLNDFDVVGHGRTIRNSALYGNEGSNINFVDQITADSFNMRTYERGVEDETLACGTGATAVAIAMFATNKTNSNKVNLIVEGGKLSVSFSEKDGVYTDVFLTGPAMFVFKGEIEC